MMRKFSEFKAFRRRRNARGLEGSSKSRGRESDDTGSLDTTFSFHEENRPKELRCIDKLGSPIKSLIFLTDGEYVVSGCQDGLIQRWRVSDCREIKPVMKSGGMVNSVAASPDGRWIVSGGVGREVTILDAVNNQTAGVERYLAGVTALDISPDSSRVATGLENGLVIVWLLASRKRIAGSLRHQESQISSVKFSPSSDRLASACSSWGCDSICVWDSRTGDLLAYLSTDTKPTFSLAWTFDDQRLFAGGPRGSIRCFDVANESLLSGFGDQTCDSVTSLCISHNDRFLVAGSASGCSFSLWDVNTFLQIRHTLFQESEVLALVISPDDQRLVIGTGDKKISIHSLSKFLPMTYSFHCLSPFLMDSEPFTYISKAAYEAWRRGELAKVDDILSKEITNCPAFVAYSHANRAIVRARLRNWDNALESPLMSNDAHVPPIAYAAKCFVLFGRGKHEEATEAIELALCSCDDTAKPFVELLKFIMLFEVGCHGEVEAFCYKIDPSSRITGVKSLFSIVKAKLLFLLAQCSTMEQNYTKTIHLLTKAQDFSPFNLVPELRTISLVFGWNFDGLSCMIQKQKCEALFASGRARDAIDALVVMQSDLREEIEKRKEMHDWLNAFKEQCLETSGSLGEEAMRNENYDVAIAWYSAALDLNPASPEHVFMQRSEAYAAKDLWEEALMDANKAIAHNALLSQAFKMKFRALRKLEWNDEFSQTLNELPDELCHQQWPAREAIDKTVNETLHNIPLRMIDTKTGHLCERARVRSVFESDQVFADLLVSTTEHMDIAHIESVVKKFFGYVMFSHRWQGREPLYNDVANVEDQSVDNLPTAETVVKLQTFCRTAKEAGYRWAWSDTCCIDQNNQREHGDSINSMFRWYRHSSLTLVYLFDVSPSLEPGGLTGSAWITRGWTLQELLAPSVIRFYNADWTLYLFDSRLNHKDSDVIMGEIASAVGVRMSDLRSFSPSSDDARWKLHVASMRDTTVPQDSAYCLFGIFNIVMPVIPGELPYHAVGRLLQEVIIRSKSGDVGCLAWVGKPSELSSWLPAQIKVYHGSCHTPTSIGEEDIQRSVAELDSSFTGEYQAKTLALYDRLECQRRAEFNGWHLRLPCIVFLVTACRLHRVESESSTNVYIAQATALEETRVCTVDKLPLKGLLLVCPWIHELLDFGPPHGHQLVEADFERASDHLPETRAELISHENMIEPARPHALDDDLTRPDRLRVPYISSGRSTPCSSLPSPSTLVGERTRALRFVARLGHPMTALLLWKQRGGVYKRVATDNEIVIKVRRGTILEGKDVEIVEII